jgi:tellurite resistance protein TerC
VVFINLYEEENTDKYVLIIFAELIAYRKCFQPTVYEKLERYPIKNTFVHYIKKGMTPEQITYLVFGAVLILALAVDLGLLSKKNTHITLKKAMWQTIFWVSLAMAFFVFIWLEDGQTVATKYLAAYLLEWSLSIDNIFVFILLFTFFKVKDAYYARLLLIGILLAIVLRIGFIAIGIALVEKFEWILYLFGALLVYTGIKMFSSKHEQEDEEDLSKNRIFSFLKKVLPLTADDGAGKFTVVRDGKKYYTSLFVVVIMLATTDIVFAIDSIPAVFGVITEKVNGRLLTTPQQNQLIAYTSNIFAVLGLRSLFFLLKGVVNKFAYLQQGVAIILVFIGVKMLIEHFVYIPVYISLLVIVVCIVASILYSLQKSAEQNDE